MSLTDSITEESSDAVGDDRPQIPRGDVANLCQRSSVNCIGGRPALLGHSRGWSDAALLINEPGGEGGREHSLTANEI